MPRRNNNRKGKGRGGDSNSEDESINDNASIYSLQSENATSLDESDEVIQAERYEEKFMQALENIQEKSVQTRVQALQSMCEALMHRYMPDFIEDRKITLIDAIERSIRRGKGAEQACGAKLAPLLVLQLGGDESVCKSLNQFLQTIIQDKSVTFDARAKCCAALGLLNFLSGDDIGDLLALMQQLESIFAGSYLRGDDKTPISVNADAGAMHAEALSAWGLLLTLIPAGDFVSLISRQQMFPSIKKLMGLLESPHLDVRMAAGEAIALVYESGRSHDEDFMETYLDDLIIATKQLATDSHKYRAKRDRKTQRATFRDLLRYLEEDISPEINIRFGTESLVLDTWAMNHQYTALCTVMGPGMTLHLQENDLVRDVFQLGAKVVQCPITKGSKQSKHERHLLNAAAFKARTITRGKNRDKRSAVFN